MIKRMATVAERAWRKYSNNQLAVVEDDAKLSPPQVCHHDIATQVQRSLLMAVF